MAVITLVGCEESAEQQVSREQALEKERERIELEALPRPERERKMFNLSYQHMEKAHNLERWLDAKKSRYTETTCGEMYSHWFNWSSTQWEAIKYKYGSFTPASEEDILTDCRVTFFSVAEPSVGATIEWFADHPFGSTCSDIISQDQVKAVAVSTNWKGFDSCEGPNIKSLYKRVSSK